MTNLPDRIRSLSPERQALLAILRRERAERITPRPAARHAPLSFAQQRMWFLDRFDPGKPAYNVYTAVRLRGRLEPAILKRAVAALCERHEILRTGFALVDGAVVSSVREPAPVALLVVDIGGPDAEATARRLVVEETRRPFDLTEGRPLRVRLLRGADDDHLLVLTIHHIAADGWSVAVLVEEIAALYRAFAADRPDPMTPPEIQYADYAVWQREFLTDERLADGLRYWRDQLADAPALLELPTDHPRPAHRSGEGRRLAFALTRELSDAVREVARGERATVFMVLLAAFSAVLGRYAGQDDVCVGTPVANRERPETEALVGFFANTLVLRSRLSPGLTFRELLHEVRRTTLTALDHQSVPFERLVEELRPDRDLSYTPLFQAMLILQNQPAARLATPDLTLEEFEVHNGSAKFDLSFMFFDEPELSCWAEYATDLFDDDTVARFIDSYQTFLTRAVADPEAPLWRIDLIGQEQRHQMVQAEAASRGVPSPGGHVHDLIDEQARRTPEAIALTGATGSLTYRELNQRANALAHRLRAHGAGPEAPLGVVLERSPELVVTLLAVLKAGAAYVPVEPGHPPERLRQMLRGAGVRLLVTEPGLVPQDVADELTVLSPAATAGETARATPSSFVTGDSLAYIIHTSGSTGVPKGVMGTHRGMLNRLLWLRDTYQLDETDRVLFKTPASVDTSIEEIFLPLLVGGRVVVAAPGGHRDPACLVDVIRAEHVTRLRFVPSMLEPFLAEPGATQCTSLRLVLSGGERLPRALERRFLKLLDARLDNVYGPTEASIDVTWWRCHTADDRPRVPIGHPMAGATIHVLDDRLRPVPVGVPGELYIGGACVTRGYVGRPGLTAERFVADPFTTEPGGRLYRTGDRARYLADGGIDYLDRVDNQVQLRGFRIEPGEIEAALARHPALRSVAVAARRTGEGPLRLVAYLTLTAPRPSVSELRTYLRGRLPDHMVPATFMFLDALPLTANGKVDRRRLPLPDDQRPEVGSFAAPVKETEHTLAELWASVLDVDRVGIDDNFFALGGDSILSIKVVSRARELGLDVTVRQVFEHQTVRELAQVATAARGPARPGKPFEMISEEDRDRLPGTVRDAYPLSGTQAGMLFDTEATADHSLHRQVLTLHLRGRLDPDRLAEVVAGICARHPVLRTSIEMAGYAEPLQLVHREIPVPLEVVDLRGLPAQEREEWLAEWTRRERARPLDLGTAPLFLIHACRWSEHTFQLSLSTSALILDGWSNASLLSELLHHYAAALAGRTMRAEAPASLYREFVRCEREVAASAEQHAYWAEQLDRPAARLPTRPPEVSDASGDGEDAPARHEVALPEHVERGLRALATLAAVPLKSVLLAAHLRVLSLLTGRSHVATGLLANGRLEEGDGERVLGQFLNVVPQGMTLRPGSWSDLVRQTFEAERSGLPFRRYPMTRAGAGQDAAHLETGFNFVHFHVYGQLRDVEGLQLLGASAANSTNFTLFAEFSVDPLSSRIGLDLQYDGGRIGRVQAAQIGACYADVLAAMASDPTRRHHAYRAPSQPGRHADEHADAGNRQETGAAPGGGRTIPELFEEQARRSPGGVALVHDGACLSYAELNLRANRLAHYLRGQGVTDETPVGVCLERSFDLMVAMLATLKAGGAYLPIDPAAPPKRRADLLAQAAPAMLVTRTELAPPECGGSVVRVDRDAARISRYGSENPAPRVRPDQLACLIATSGSSGRPKTVALPHRQVVNRLAWSWRTHPFKPGEVGCQKTPISFVDALWESLGPLLRGVPSVLIPHDMLRDPPRLVATLAEHRVTRVLLVPTLLRMLLDDGGDLPGTLPALWLWTTSGEPLTPDLAEEFEARLPDRTLVNVYGATEAWDATGFELGRVARHRATVPVGRPADGMRVHLLDSNCQPAPVGAVGEVYVAGAGVARCYLGAPGLTAERFVASPFHPGERMYRTGDLGRYAPDGELELLGRGDDQVKIGGIRIEPAEIETVLLRHPDVRQAAVVTGAEPAPRITAHLVTDGGPTPRELARFARERLPVNVPFDVRLVDEIPRTATGKVDRRALSAVPDHRRNALVGGVLDSPRSPLEETLIAAWEVVLRREGVGVHDNFFELGGNSLGALQLLARIRATVGSDVTVRELFRSPTVAELARQISVARSEGRRPRTPLAPSPEASPQRGRPLSFAQQRLWYLHQLDPWSASYNLHVAVRMAGRLDADALERALAEILRRHESLRTAFPVRDGMAVQRVQSVPARPLARMDLGGQDGERTLAETVLAEIQRPFDLERGPLSRTTLIRLATDDHLAILVVHHIAGDAWSMRVMMRELSILYRAFLTGEDSPLPEPTVQYADFASWQRAELNEEVLGELEAYWQRRLANAPLMLDLAPDRPRDARRGRGDTQIGEIPRPLAEAAKKVAVDSGATLFMCLLAAFSVVLHHRTGREDLIVGTDAAGRDEEALEDLIGFFVNQLAIRVDLTGNPTFRELLRRTRETTLSAYDHRELPFERLVQVVGPRRSLSHAPIMQVKLVLHNVPEEMLDLPGLRLTPFEVSRGTSQLDLNLRVAEEATGLRLSAEYDAELFPAATVRSLLAQLRVVLERATEAPDTLLTDLSEQLTAEQEREGTRRHGEREAASVRRLRAARRRPLRVKGTQEEEGSREAT
ncbi:non-ribosomal peptide synthetase [Streptomyces sp. ME19-01-6]|uniref:non-ribosomal peptide synthetase n=1 Tax=Streptomyces sp. ME19-01-6 TaxID=3028686 RepID=UPI0029AF1D58|nr:non-ribosomal peptide synthetase [Streptomyces sp. ME19-01-6]MDX3229588.1 amino acid adenylation domain-containing protein [Streptomyces sp. ME19-01-6]